MLQPLEKQIKHDFMSSATPDQMQSLNYLSLAPNLLKKLLEQKLGQVLNPTIFLSPSVVLMRFSLFWGSEDRLLTQCGMYLSTVSFLYFVMLSLTWIFFSNETILKRINFLLNACHYCFFSALSPSTIQKMQTQKEERNQDKPSWKKTLLSKLLPDGIAFLTSVLSRLLIPTKTHHREFSWILQLCISKLPLLWSDTNGTSTDNADILSSGNT